MEAATRADWWLGLVELTTAVLTRCVRPAVEPAQSKARLYEATTCTHSRKFHKKTPRLPVVPAVAETKYLPWKSSLPRSVARYCSISASRGPGRVTTELKLSIRV